jgi:hypothetical protein
LKSNARAQLLILDDWGLANVTADQGRDRLEIFDDRQGRGSTNVTSQVDVKHWHEMIANPTVADAILDRLVHSAHRLNLVGESLRDPRNKTVKRGKLDTDAAARPVEPVDGWRCPASSDCCPQSLGSLSGFDRIQCPASSEYARTV